MNITEEQLEERIESYRNLLKCTFVEWRLKEVDEVFELARQGLRLQQAEKEVVAVIELCPNAVRVCESNGPENIYASLAVTVAKLCHSLEAANKELKIATIKANSSLANNLCPDHRDKQQGKPCLACSLEAAKRDTERLDWLEMVQGRTDFDDMDICKRDDGYFISFMFNQEKDQPPQPTFRQAIDHAINAERKSE